MSGDHNMNQTSSAWRKRQIALNKKAENARELGLDYEPDKTVMDMARQVGYPIQHEEWRKATEEFAALVREEQQTEVQRLIALVRAQQITIDKLEMALAQPEQEPVACKHEWFRTGAMQLWEYRCIKCGAEARLKEKNNDS
jgi:uncharacterized protein CbrC (UPF0167 family)